jgi:hypothetical protein
MAKIFFSGFWPPENHRSTFPSYLSAFAQISLFDMMDKKKRVGGKRVHVMSLVQ